MVMHQKYWEFSSASADNIKKFGLPDGKFKHNMLSKQNAIVNAMALNEDNVMISGGDNGSMRFWDYETGHCSNVANAGSTRFSWKPKLAYLR